MKMIRVITVHGKPFRRCGFEFTSSPTMLKVGPGGDMTEEQYVMLKRASVPCPIIPRHGADPEEGGVLDIVELEQPAKAAESKTEERSAKK